MVRPHVPFENFDVLAPTDFPDQIPQAAPDLPRQPRLVILRGKDEMVVQTIDAMGGATQLAHGRPSYRKPPERRGVSPIPEGDSNRRKGDGLKGQVAG